MNGDRKKGDALRAVTRDGSALSRAGCCDGVSGVRLAQGERDKM